MLLYSIRKTFGAVENRVDVDMREVKVCISETVPKGFYPCDADIFELCNILMEENPGMFHLMVTKLYPFTRILEELSN